MSGNFARAHKPGEKRLSVAEALELDSFGELFGFQLLGIFPWQREILYGSDAIKPLNFDGLMPVPREAL